MRNALRAVTVVLIVATLLIGAVGSVRLARRGGTAARLIANALILGLGMGIVVNPHSKVSSKRRKTEMRRAGNQAIRPQLAASGRLTSWHCSVSL